MFKSGFISVIGRPNAGKSTLVNALAGFKAAIVTDKPQTTRNRIMAVLTRENSQFIFMDTPGVHKPHNMLGSYMYWSARNSLKDVDGVLFLADGSQPPGKGDSYIADMLFGVKVPVFLVLNKADLLNEKQALSRLEKYRQLYAFKDEFLVSALQGFNLEGVLSGVESILPEGPMYFPSDMVTDQPESFVISEIVREKIMQRTRQEVPFSVAVEIEEYRKREHKDIIDIRVTIYVEKKSQKGIIVGKEGKLLREIGTRARKEIENLLGMKIYLDLWVKVKPDWREKEGFLQQMGYSKK